MEQNYSENWMKRRNSSETQRTGGEVDAAKLHDALLCGYGAPAIQNCPKPTAANLTVRSMLKAEGCERLLGENITDTRSMKERLQDKQPQQEQQTRLRTHDNSL